MATDVTVTFDPPAPAADKVAAMPGSTMLKWIYERYSTPVTTWGPGWTASNVIRAGDDQLEAISVIANYNGPDGHHYEDHYSLNPDHIMKETVSTPSKSNDPMTVEQQKVKALQALVRTLRDM